MGTSGRADARLAEVTARARSFPNLDPVLKCEGVAQRGTQHHAAIAHVKRLADGVVGVERLLWGSDWPHTNHEGVAN